MTAQQTATYGTASNPLCERLRREFRGRGAAAASVRAVSTSAMVERVQRGLNPYENVPDPARDTVSDAAAQTRVMQKTSARPAVQKNAAQTRAMPKTSARPAARENAAQTRAMPKTSARPAARKNDAQTRVMPKVSARPAQKNAAQTADAKNTPVRRLLARLPLLKPAPVSDEIKVARAPFPIAAISLLTVFTMMFLVIIFSFAQNYVLTGEIAALEARAEALAQQERDLSVRLEERDDIRVIEDIAVNRIGMVKGTTVESRYISVSGGERVELLSAAPEESAEQASGGIFSTMLSAISENLQRLREYVD